MPPSIDPTAAATSPRTTFQKEQTEAVDAGVSKRRAAAEAQGFPTGDLGESKTIA